MHKATAALDNLVLFPKQILSSWGNFHFHFNLPSLSLSLSEFIVSTISSLWPRRATMPLLPMWRVWIMTLWWSSSTKTSVPWKRPWAPAFSSTSSSISLKVRACPLCLGAGGVPALLDYRRSKCIRKSCLLVCLDWKCCTQLHVWVNRQRCHLLLTDRWFLS